MKLSKTGQETDEDVTRFPENRLKAPALLRILPQRLSLASGQSFYTESGQADKMLTGSHITPPAASCAVWFYNRDWNLPFTDINRSVINDFVSKR